MRFVVHKLINDDKNYIVGFFTQDKEMKKK